MQGISLVSFRASTDTASCTKLSVLLGFQFAVYTHAIVRATLIMAYLSTQPPHNPNRSYNYKFVVLLGSLSKFLYAKVRLPFDDMNKFPLHDGMSTYITSLPQDFQISLR
jgi:hypothetical protein